MSYKTLKLCVLYQGQAIAQLEIHWSYIQEIDIHGSRNPFAGCNKQNKNRVEDEYFPLLLSHL